VLEVEDHVLYDFVEHVEELFAEDHSHFAFAFEEVFGLANATTELGDEVGGVGKGCCTLAFAGKLGGCFFGGSVFGFVFGETAGEDFLDALTSGFVGFVRVFP